MSGPERRLLTPDEAAAYLGINRKTLLDWARAGKIGVVKVGRLPRFLQADLDKWIESRRRAPMDERRFKRLKL